MPDLTLIPSSHNSSKSSISDSDNDHDDDDDGLHKRAVDLDTRRPSLVTFELTFDDDDDESETPIWGKNWRLDGFCETESKPVKEI